MIKLPKKLVTGLKIVVSVLLLYFIFTKIDLKAVGTTLRNSHLGYLFIALLLFTLSKILAAFRVNLYFHQLKVKLTQLSNLKLALLGMFYNLFLPGGIGGDAYKGFLIKKKYGISGKRIAASLVIDRLSGLLLLFIYACILGFMINIEIITPYKPLFIVLAVLSIATFWFLNKKFFGYLLPVFWKSFGYSALVQLTQLISVFFILKALSIEENTMLYLLIFLISSFVSVLPLTIGGIGSREVTFLYGAKWLGLDQNTSISISMVVFLITALISLFGVIYHFKNLELETEKD